MNVGKARLQRLLDKHLGAQKIPAELRHLIEFVGRQLDLLVLQQAAHQLGARVFGFLTFGDLFRRQQHARLDFDQHRGHQQIFGCQLQIGGADLVNIHQVLARDGGHRDVKNVEVLLANQVEQQVQRTFKGLQKHLQGIRRDVQVMRHRKQRLAIQTGQGDLVHHDGHVRAQDGRQCLPGCGWPVLQAR